jgi:hypothetical protein
MFCPKCGQEQAADDVRFCSRCGFPLVEVTGLLERGGAAAAPREDDALPDRRVRKALYILAAALPLLAVALVLGLAEVDGGPEIFGLLGALTFWIGLVRLIYVLAFKKGKRLPETPPPGQPTSRLDAPRQQALPPPYAPPVAVPRGRFDTGEIAQPLSVTEHTTRHLEQEPPPEPER